MKTRVTPPGCLLVGLLITLAVVIPFGLLYDPWTTGDALEAAPIYAKDYGIEVEPRGWAEFVTQPDLWGGCEVETRLWATTGTNSDRQVVMRLRRSWRLGAWEVTAFTVHDADGKRK